MFSLIIAVSCGLATGLALGGGIVISQYFGAGKSDQIRLCATTSAYFSALVQRECWIHRNREVLYFYSKNFFEADRVT